jgi:hypothetical protein
VTEQAAPGRCCTCEEEIDRCAGCDRADCAESLCYGCLNESLRQDIPQPHAHGG